ncbi:alpha/beta fold hydrolase [Lentzea sp. NEAU-D7]|uniref:alpha/beta fold hydrolase n=1 Tax=Lentzea sp. NEAU-D7 TaxID=2994667 RepID=UPI00224B3B02|nr:alpha/beta hydrolase [Lentzea sp. NEAU-D7]MCX2948904.1 alpha/beta hydrolase [Lentzea sp. NEAU-D7]
MRSDLEENSRPAKEITIRRRLDVERFDAFAEGMPPQQDDEGRRDEGVDPLGRPEDLQARRRRSPRTGNLVPHLKGDECKDCSTVRVEAAGHEVLVRQADHPGDHPTPVVLVHGMAVCSRYLVPTMTRLAQSRTVVAPDLPGFGRSSEAGPPISVRDAAEVLRAVMTRLTGPAIVMGHSAGCHAAVELAVRHPELVRRLVLVSPPPGHRHPLAVIIRWAQAMAQEPSPLVAETLRDAVIAGPRKVWGAFRHLLSYRLRATLRRVGCPVLLVRGARDPLVPRAVARHLADIAQRGRYAEVPGCHAVPYTSPDDLARVILEVDPANERTAAQQGDRGSSFTTVDPPTTNGLHSSAREERERGAHQDRHRSADSRDGR